MLLTRIVGMLSGGAFSAWWLQGNSGHDADEWAAYVFPACLGAALMLTAIVPLLRLPEPTTSSIPARLLAPSCWWQPLADRNMRWLLAFGAWFSLANGLTQSAQYIFPIAVFGLSLFARQMLEASMRFAQSLGASSVGQLADRCGNRGLLVASQLVIALAPLSLFIASRTATDEPPVYNDGSHWWDYSPEPWWTHGGAWVCLTWVFWVAYVGLNVGLPNLMLKLAAPGERASYIAWYFALTGVVYGLCTIAGGALYSYLEKAKTSLDVGVVTFDYNELLFLAGFMLRASAIVCLLPIVESYRLPPASAGGKNEIDRG